MPFGFSIKIPLLFAYNHCNMAAPIEVQQDHLSTVQHVILVMSGKGGVGKSTVATELALCLKHAGKKVGLLDIDLCGPSIPKMFNVQDRDIHQCPEGWLPVFVDEEQRLGIMSIAFLLNNTDDAVVWRGPKKNAMIKQFLSDVVWRDVDYLIIDTPPGTSDEHITVIESLRAYNPDGAILVTTPQVCPSISNLHVPHLGISHFDTEGEILPESNKELDVAVGDVRRELTFCKKTGIPVIGLIENMSGFVCPYCSECTNVFSKGGGEALAKQFGVAFLGSLPLDGNLTQSLDEGKIFSKLFQDSATSRALTSVINRLLLIDRNLP